MLRLGAPLFYHRLWHVFPLSTWSNHNINSSEKKKTHRRDKLDELNDAAEFIMRYWLDHEGIMFVTDPVRVFSSRGHILRSHTWLTVVHLDVVHRSATTVN